MNDYSIFVLSTGEEIVYEEGDKQFCFEVRLSQAPIQLFVGRYWTDSPPVVFSELTEPERHRIIPRLVAYLGSHGDEVELIWKAFHQT